MSLNKHSHSMNPEIFLTGSNGFVGSYLTKYWEKSYKILPYKREDNITISSPYTIHLAGIAHDVKNATTDTRLSREVNVELTKKVFDAFLQSDSSEVFIFLSSIKAVVDSPLKQVLESDVPQPIGIYGISKLEAEQYILSKQLPVGKRVYILRPALIHGPNNKGNLALLQKFINTKIPWPFAAFHNQRSYCSIQNLTFIIEQLLMDREIPSEIYHIADDDSISTNQLIGIMAKAQGKHARYLPISEKWIIGMAKLGDRLRLPFNTEKLNKLTGSFIVSNEKIKNAMGKHLPFSCEQGFLQNLK